MPTPRYSSSRIALAHDLADAVARGDVERGRGAFLPDLLVAALQRAVALAEMDGVALAVAEHLDFDVARLLEIFLEIDRVVAERRLALRCARWRARSERSSAVCATFMPRPPPPAAALTSTGIADRLARSRSASSSAVTPPSEPGTTGMPRRLRGALGLDLVAHQADVLGLRADEVDVVLFEDFGEARVLGQEAVARMHGVGAGDLAGGEQRRNVEIAVARRRRPDADALVGEPHMHGVGVGGRMHGDGRDAELLAGAQHAQRDLAAVGDEDFFEHRTATACRERRHSMIISGSPNSTGWPSSTRICTTRAGARRGDLVHGLHRFDDQQRSGRPAPGCRLRRRAARPAPARDRRCRPSARARRPDAWRGRRRGASDRGGRAGGDAARGGAARRRPPAGPGARRARARRRARTRSR